MFVDFVFISTSFPFPVRFDFPFVFFFWPILKALFFFIDFSSFSLSLFVFSPVFSFTNLIFFSFATRCTSFVFSITKVLLFLFFIFIIFSCVPLLKFVISDTFVSIIFVSVLPYAHQRFNFLISANFFHLSYTHPEFTNFHMYLFSMEVNYCCYFILWTVEDNFYMNPSDSPLLQSNLADFYSLHIAVVVVAIAVVVDNSVNFCFHNYFTYLCKFDFEHTLL